MSSQKNSKPLNITLWVLQALIALSLTMTGFMKLTMPIAKLSAMLPWTGQVPEGMVRGLAIIDLLGALGLILPAALRIKPQLTAWAAVGVLALMMSASIFHISRGEGALIMPNVIFGLIAAFIAWGRFTKAPVQPKRY